MNRRPLSWKNKTVPLFITQMPGEGRGVKSEGRVGRRGEASASRGEEEGKDNGRRKEAGGEELWRRQGEGEDDSAVPRRPLIDGGGDEGGCGGCWLVAAQSRPPHSLAAGGEARKWRRHGSGSACEVVEMCF